MALALQRMNMRVAQAPVASRSSAFLASPVAPVTRAVVAPVKASPTTVQVECKAKTRKAAAKRFKVTGGGIVMARRSGKQHLNEKMSRDKKRELSNMVVVSKTDIYNITKCLPNHGIGK